MSSTLHKTKKTVRLGSDVVQSCQECHESWSTDTDVAQQINHYLGHGYKLLHLGTETGRDYKEEVYYAAVAIVGK